MIRILCLIAGLLLIVACCAPAQAGIKTTVFDFESQPVTFNGGLSSLTVTKDGLSIAIDRGGQPFDIANLSGLGHSAPFGARSLAPTPLEASFFNVNFSQPITRFSAHFIDSTGESADLLALRAFSGRNGTGTVLGSSSATLPLNADATLAFKTLQVSGQGIESVRLIGGTLHAPNSVFYDNFNVTANLTASGHGVSAVPLPPGIYVMPICGVIAWFAARRLRWWDGGPLE